MPAQRTRDTTLEADVPRCAEIPRLLIVSPYPLSPSPCRSNLDVFNSYPTSPSSPVETNLHSPFMQSPLPSLINTSLSPSLSKTRRTSSSVGVIRRPKKGDEDYIKRPENAFILFRRKTAKDAKASSSKKRRQADLSKTISQQWKNLTPSERAYWETLAKQKKREHADMYPGYVYRPQRRNGKKSSGSESIDVVTADSPCSLSRSSSAPTLPSLQYQIVEVPVAHAVQSTMLVPGSQDFVPDNGFNFMPHLGSFDSYQLTNDTLYPTTLDSLPSDPYTSPASSGPQTPPKLFMPYDDIYSPHSYDLWQNGTDIILPNDFDMNAIPPLEIEYGDEEPVPFSSFSVF